MGTYINPGNEGFRAMRRGLYVDKTMLISVINHTIGTTDKLSCVARPRRFGKSFAAKTLCAYYDRSCDSDDLFQDMEIVADPTYEQYRNRYNVVYLDITGFLSDTQNKQTVVKDIREKVGNELAQMYPACPADQPLSLQMLAISQYTGIPFVVIIDEWDAIFRECKNDSRLQKEYIELLRSLFKNATVTDRTFAAVYMTGILPIKKYGTESAMTDFREYTMLSPGIMAQFMGFTSEEVQTLCRQYNMPFETMQEWYDGYSFRGLNHIYSPNSVIMAIRNQSFDSYWTETETYTSLKLYIEMDLDGLQAALIQMIGGSSVPIDTGTFQNDMTTIHNRNDVMTLLVHLGYLTYDAEQKAVRIPDEEVRQEFVRTIRTGSHTTTAKIIRDSDQLLLDTINQNETAVASAIEEAHDAGTTPLFYNDEQALRSVVKTAYISCADHYVRVEELPGGRGFADLVYIPKKHSSFPLLVIELKWNHPADTALEQIRRNKYPMQLKDIGGDCLLVGISYDEKTRKHSCRIEKLGYCLDKSLSNI